MYKIGVIGDKDSALGFMAVGFMVRPVSDRDDAAKALEEMAKDDYAVIFITEELAIQLEEEILKYRDAPLPAVISIPSKNGSTGYGMASIKRSVENAIGADILFKDDK